MCLIYVISPIPIYGPVTVCMLDWIHLSFSSPYLFQDPKGTSCARSDNTKSIKGAILDWISHLDALLNLPLSCNIKTNWGFHHPTTVVLLCPAGVDWNNPE
jgi:hypothetical protein